VGFLVVITIGIVAALLEERKIAVTEFITKGDSKISYSPAAIRLLVKVFSIINHTISMCIQDIIYAECNGSFIIFKQVLSYSKV